MEASFGAQPDCARARPYHLLADTEEDGWSRGWRRSRATSGTGKCHVATSRASLSGSETEGRSSHQIRTFGCWSSRGNRGAWRALWGSSWTKKRGQSGAGGAGSAYGYRCSGRTKGRGPRRTVAY